MKQDAKKMALKSFMKDSLQKYGAKRKEAMEPKEEKHEEEDEEEKRKKGLSITIMG